MVAVDDEERDLVTAGHQLLGRDLGRDLVADQTYVVLPLVAREGLGQLGLVVGGGDDDRGSAHPPSVVGLQRGVSP